MSVDTRLTKIDLDISRIGFGEVDANLYQPTQIKTHTIVIPLILTLAVILAAAAIGSGVGGIVAGCTGVAVIAAYGASAGAGLGVVGMGVVAGVVAQRTFKAPENLPVQWNPANGPKPKSVGEFQENNQVIFLENAEATSEKKLEMLAKANYSIEISGNFVGGELFREALLIIESRLKEAPLLQVYILGANTLIEDADLVRLKEIKALFPTRFHYQITDLFLRLAPDISTLENHVKLVIVDEYMYVLGGTSLQEGLGRHVGTAEVPLNPNGGLAARIVGRGFRDKDMLGYGSATKTVRWEFFKLYAAWESITTKTPGKNIPNRFFKVEDQQFKVSPSAGLSPARVKILVSQPHCPNAITDAYIKLIDGCARRIFISNMMLDCKKIMPSLMKAAAQGKQICVVTNGIHDKSPMSHTLCLVRKNWVNYLQLMVGRAVQSGELQESLAKEILANVKIYEFAVAYITLHCKIMVVDDTLIIGSYNLSQKSDSSDYESAAVVEQAHVAEAAVMSTKLDASLSTEVTFDQAYGYYQSSLAHIHANYFAGID